MFWAYLPFVTPLLPLAITPPIVVLVGGASSTTIPSDISWILAITAGGYLWETHVEWRLSWLTVCTSAWRSALLSQPASQPVSPAAQEDVVGPDHWEGQQLVQATAGDSGFHHRETLHVPQYELSPGQPLLVGLTVAPKGLHPLGHLRVLGQVLWNVDVISAPPLRHPYKTKMLPVE